MNGKRARSLRKACDGIEIPSLREYAFIPVVEGQKGRLYKLDGMTRLAPLVCVSPARRKYKMLKKMVIELSHDRT